ncbi:hypothetical protein I3271_09420 [Photobacterium leiognathi]|uniref:hypothetical protein n=1 Tax=Photobacterium leiognathi TaxID=553611 RepID=UPI001EE06C38|nr:hypothetical protein [Photobacterium leiognathi]MCG3884906.1 hypothetical protein [Photobacterium leiognathi]
MIGENAHFITVGTFHSICFREMLSNFKDSSYLAEIGVDMETASIMDDKDSDRLFKEAIDELPEQYKAIVDENDWGVKTF